MDSKKIFAENFSTGIKLGQKRGHILNLGSISRDIAFMGQTQLLSQILLRFAPPETFALSDAKPYSKDGFWKILLGFSKIIFSNDFCFTFPQFLRQKYFFRQKHFL